MFKAATAGLVVVVRHKTQVVVVVRHWGVVAVLSRTAVTTGLRPLDLARVAAVQVLPRVVQAVAAALVVMLKN
jgi:hypothetical protein